MWGQPQEAAFQLLKDRLQTAPILALPAPDRPYTLFTDFCGASVSAVLEQQQADGKLHPVAYASKTCTPSESRYGSTDGELLALVFGVTKYHHYLAGTPFTVVTDHAALLYLDQAKAHNSRLARWALRLADYDFCVQYRQGGVHGNADGLTRAAATPSAPCPVSLHFMEASTAADEEDPLGPLVGTCTTEEDAVFCLLPVCTA